MKDSWKLVHGFRSLVERLRKDKIEYFWGENQHCNCGVVAQHLLGMESLEIEYYLEGYEDNGQYLWSEMDVNNDKVYSIQSSLYIKDRTCPVTKYPINFIFQKLSEWGFEDGDYEELEFLGLCSYREFELGSHKPDVIGYGVRKNLEDYLEGKANRMEQRLRLNERVKVEIPVNIQTVRGF